MGRGRVVGGRKPLPLSFVAVAADRTAYRCHVLVWPARSSVSEVPLFMHPKEEYLIGFGILPAVPPKMWETVRPRLQAASELSIAMGGKRYLSGFIDFTTDEWRQHFGDRFEPLAALKRQHDPEGRLNPGFVKFGPPPQ